MITNRCSGEHAASCSGHLDACRRCDAPPSAARIAHYPDDAWLIPVIEADALASYLQPIVRASDGVIYGYEALLRGRDPGSGELILAGPILAAGERLGIQNLLDQRARRAAIRAAARQTLENSAGLSYFINFLPSTIYDPEVCLRTTLQAMEEFGVPPSQFVFEVVESEQIADLAHLSTILNYYRSRGIRTAVDDMGAGFTSIGYVAELQPDYVKIDRDSVLAAAQSDEAVGDMRVIVETIQRLGSKVIAEGIETVEQLQACRRMGVDFVQGYLLGRPADPPVASVQPEFFTD